MRLIEDFWRGRQGGIVSTVAKIAGSIALLSVLAVQFMPSGRLDTDGLGRLASAASGAQGNDPMVTGSIAQRAAHTRLDPCRAD